MKAPSRSDRRQGRHALRALGPFAAMGVLVAVAGCASLAPTYERPPAPVPAQFPDAAAAAASAAAAPAAAAADIPWQQFFTDPGLRRLIGLALRDNRDLRVAALNIEQAQAQARVRDADLWPTLGAGVTGLRQPNGTGAITSLYTGGLQMSSYEIDLFGRLRNLGDAAAAQVLASTEARKAVQIGLVASVANGWLALLADDELLRDTARTLATREDSYRLTKLRFDNGASSALDLHAAESLLAAARVALAQQTRQRALDRNALALLIGQPVPPALPASPTLDAMPRLPELPAGLPSEVLARRPDVRQAELQLIAANANIGAARAAFFPKISLTASVGSASNALSGLFKAGSFAWSVAPQAIETIFDAGRNRANLEIAQVGREIAVAQYEKAIESAFREVADALAGRATLAQQLQAQRAQVQAEQGRVDLTELRWRNGAANTLELLDAQRSLFAAQQALVQLRTEDAQNLVTLYRVLGGGWAADPAAQ